MRVIPGTMRNEVNVDGQHFDEMTKALARGESRRRLVKRLVGGAAAVALASAGTHRGAQAVSCRAKGATCIANATCCSGLCDQRTRRCVQFECVGVGPLC